MLTFIRRSFYLLLLAAAGIARVPAQDHLSIAAAANLVYALDPLNAEFGRTHPGIKVTRSIGASGSLVAQIENGAPYDVFLSADMTYAQKLVQAGGGEAASLRPFAIGRLVLWTTRPGLAIDSVAALVRDPSVHRLAIANPRTAPYGFAAQEVLARLQLTETAQPKLVQGENISQTAEFVETGNADAGFVALSLVLASATKNRGRWLEVPAELYSPLTQAALITRQGRDNPAARAYLEFLTSPAAQAIFKQFGYASPKP